MSRKIIHLDMDAFYASVEQRDDARLRGKPIAVGGAGNRGVVAAASYEARRYGVHSAMNMSRALRLCPDLIVVPVDMGRYATESRKIRDILHRATDIVEPLSLDEAYLDVTENKLGLATATEVAEWLRAAIHEEVGLTASAGVAPLKFVAKIASDFRKPDGLTVVKPHHVLEFIRPMPVSRLWGVGPSTEKALKSLGIHTVADLADSSTDALFRRLGSRGQQLYRMAHGEDARPVRTSRPRKSRGAERTFPEDVTDLDALRQVIDQHCGRIASSGAARTVTLKLRYDDFETITRSHTLDHATADPEQHAALAWRLLVDETEAGTRPVRLLGVSLSNFAVPTGGPQLPLPLEEVESP